MDLKQLYDQLMAALSSGHPLCIGGAIGRILVYVEETFCPDHPPGPVVFATPEGESCVGLEDCTYEELKKKGDECIGELCKASGAVTPNNPWAMLLMAVLSQILRRFLENR